MSTEIASAYVRIRPNVAGFRSETESGLKHALGQIGKITGGVLALGGATEAIIGITKAAAQEEVELAAVKKSVENASAAWVIHGKTVEEILKGQARATGFQVADLEQGFTRIESGTRNTEKSLKLLTAAEDISRARHLGLAQASIILTRASEGSVASLRRLGIIFPPITKAEDDLKRQHLELLAAGVKLNEGQKAQYEASLAQAKALDHQASKTNVLAQVNARFGGQASTFAKTTAGEFARASEGFRQFEVSIGTAFLPSLGDAARGVAHYVEELRQSEGVHHAVVSTVGAFRTIFVDLRDAIETVAPVVSGAVHGLEAITHATGGVNSIIAFAAGYKAVGLALELVSGVEARYIAVMTAGQGVQKASAASTGIRTKATQVSTVALAENTLATNANTAAVAKNAIAVDSINGLGLTKDLNAITNGYQIATLRGSKLSVVTKDVGAAAEGLGVKFATAGRGLFALAGGWTTVAAVLAGGVAFGLYKIFSAESALDKENGKLRGSLDLLGQSLQHTGQLASQFADAVSSIKTDKIQVASARLALEQAQVALAQSSAKRGSLEYDEALQRVAEAQDNLRAIERQLSVDQTNAAGLHKKHTAALVAEERLRQQAITETLKVGKEAAKAQFAVSLPRSRGTGPASDAQIERFASQGDNAAKIADRFADALHKDSEKLKEQHPFLARQIEDLDLMTRTLGHLPSRRVVQILLDTGSSRLALNELFHEFEKAKPSVSEFVHQIDRQRIALNASDPELAKRIRLLEDFAQKIGRVPTKHETDMVFKASSFKAAVASIIGELAKMKKVAAGDGFSSAEAFAQAFAQQLKSSGLLPSLKEALGAVDAGLAHLPGKVTDVSKLSLDAAKHAERAVETSIQAIDGKIADANQAVHDAGQQISGAQRDLADAIRRGAQEIHDAVSNADQNLFSIGSSLADTVGQFLDAANKTQGISPDSAVFKKLRAQILAGDGGPETRKAAQELANQIESSQGSASEAVAKQKEKVKQGIADLVDQFNKGAISLATFNKRLAALLAKAGIDYKKAGAILGIAFADGFKAQLEGIQKQAAAIGAGPHFKGVTGLEPTIVKPLETLRQTQRDIADAQRHRDQAMIAEEKAQKRLNALEEQHTRLALEESRQHTRLQRLIEQHTRFLLQEARRQTGLLKKPPPSRPDDRGGRRPTAAAGKDAKAAADHRFGG